MEQKSLINSNIPEIDVIRCFAIIQVVLFHMCTIEEPFANATALWGREGVGLFFAISAAGLINRYYYQFDWKAFFKKRTISIYIPFWVAYTAVFTRNYVINGFRFPWEYTEISRKYMLLSVFGVDCFASAVGIPNFALVGEWFIAVILFIYMAFPLWRRLFIKSPELTVALFLVLRIILSLKNPTPQLAVCFNPITALSNFSIGAYVVYFFSKRPAEHDPSIKAIVVMASLFCIVLGKYFVQKKGQLDIGEIFTTLGLLFILLVISPFVMQHAAKPVKYISGLSYEIFLVHHVVIYAYTPSIHNNFTGINALVGYIYTLLVIWMFAHVLKKVTTPIMRLFMSSGRH